MSPLRRAARKALGVIGILASWLVVSGLARAAAEEHHGIPEDASFLDRITYPWHNIEFIAAVVNFGFLLALLIFLVRTPLLNYLKDRRVAMQEGLEEANRIQAAAKEKYDVYNARLERLDEELEQLRSEMVRAGEAERDRIVAEAEEKAARMRRETSFVIEQRMKQLREDLTREAVESAIQAAEQVLREQATSADQKRVADQYLETLSGLAKKRESDKPAAAPRPARQEGLA
jgi:F-type H+-transporting ATPase subunit b